MDTAHENAPASLRTLPSRLIGQVAILADRTTERAFDGTGSRRHHYALLVTLRDCGPDSQAELSRRTGIDRSDIVAALNDLAADGYIQRSPDPHDRRRNIVTLTPAGGRHLSELDHRLSAAQNELLRGLSSARRRDLIALLTHILDEHTRR